LREPVRADDVRARRDAGEDAFLGRQATGHLDRLVVLDRLDVVDALGNPLGRARRIAVLELQPELGAVRRRAPTGADERRVTDRLEDRVHRAMIAGAIALTKSPRAPIRES